VLPVAPNIVPALMVQATLSSTKGDHRRSVGILPGPRQQPPDPSWGSTLNSAQHVLVPAPRRAVVPGLTIFLVVLGFNLASDGLHDALDPRSERR
jgi:peptide/nickel transport system permease protein